MKNKLDYLLIFRRYRRIETLDIIVQRKREKATPEEQEYLASAADHRLAEIVMKRYYTRVPASVWHWVRYGLGKRPLE
ncbi:MULTISPECIES: Hha/YmoA family nucleoid-associated regulatory protein [Providencia]|uniref:Hha/YmoA family nucleoid-associated regulatory protein n=1 Tax=Providencia rettgeri TaxID=587 RepID=A0AAJ6FXL9_PRORE|nr:MULTISPECIES: Hha/YmoA family nucleoid-associated regulatory protein [Providencia]WHT81647.1 Hha/YmoA family nucleoid-associated regulatory protein [Providencia rettgeri]WHT95733.1 Hha/YmoA family nucleoid-associated regulatory protein [Providencia rettgeri]WJM88384.1 Hha/YmoA family nucleoid-associated regulatory protein [Providencia rettgeri]